MELNDKERKVLSYFSGIEQDDFDSSYPAERDDESAEEIKVLFDVGFAFARRALTNKRKKRRFKDGEPADIETKTSPCWDGYVQVGMKKGKNGKSVPNCVPENQAKSFFLDDVEEKAAKKRLKDPKGGLTAAGRAHFKRTEGANLKPGVKGAADTPEKMRRKGSFLTRFFTNPSGPMKDEKGRPTRLALSAAAWGEPVPSDAAAAARLAEKGRNLLKRYENSKKKDADENIETKQLGPTIGGSNAASSDPDKVDKDQDGVVNDGTPDERPAKRKPYEKMSNSFLEKRRRRHVNRELRNQGIESKKPRSSAERDARSSARESFNQDEDRKRFVRNQLRKRGITANAKKADRSDEERAARREARAEYLRRVAAGERKKPTPGPVPPQRKYPDGYVPGLPADRYPEPKKDTSSQDNEDRRNRGKSPYVPGKPADRYGRPRKEPAKSDGSSERAEDERNKRKKPKRVAGPPAPGPKSAGSIARETLLPGS